jgi:hypothetical protein
MNRARSRGYREGDPLTDTVLALLEERAAALGLSVATDAFRAVYEGRRTYLAPEGQGEAREKLLEVSERDAVLRVWRVTMGYELRPPT